MFEKFTTVDARDFRQRYNGSYGFFRKGEKRYLVQLININNERNPPTVTFVDQNKGEFSLVADAVDDSVGFEFLPPRSSWKNTWDFGAVLSRRMTRRQWVRGLSDANTSFTIPGVTQIPVGFPILNELFLKTPPTFMEAHSAMAAALLKGKYQWAALSNGFAIDWRGNIACYDRNIGTYKFDAGKFDVSLNNKMFTTEIADAFRRNGVEAVVK